ncbi:MAG: hypothetical protein GX881_04005 [Firmicutes bacterium]|nr:hypothetical protein [Bacillota bacterium]
MSELTENYKELAAAILHGAVVDNRDPDYEDRGEIEGFFAGRNLRGGEPESLFGLCFPPILEPSAVLERLGLKQGRKEVAV